MKKGIANKLHQLEAIINKMSELVITTQTPNPDSPNPVIYITGEASHSQMEVERQLFSSRLTKFEFHASLKEILQNGLQK